ncbi:hypothetical protein [Polyangium sorediatum]|uniref:Uncharacterized protein n=1 Tax=Polyangium sorediatum TaxID=889274 RepID=A0ABT6NP93_9BACT|nr:hypothetical protein [Polyangium sorediatum]MDI1430150.1 hypothetical protein [Polyangium sorediatum]
MKSVHRWMLSKGARAVIVVMAQETATIDEANMVAFLIAAILLAQIT